MASSLNRIRCIGLRPMSVYYRRRKRIEIPKAGGWHRTFEKCRHAAFKYHRVNFSFLYPLLTDYSSFRLLHNGLWLVCYITLFDRNTNWRYLNTASVRRFCVMGNALYWTRPRVVSTRIFIISYFPPNAWRQQINVHFDKHHVPRSDLILSVCTFIAMFYALRGAIIFICFLWRLITKMKELIFDPPTDDC